MVLCNAIDFVLPLFTSLLIDNAIKVVNSTFEAAQRAFHLRRQQQEQKKVVRKSTRVGIMPSLKMKSRGSSTSTKTI
jgi:hypothetical protein